MNYKDIKEAQAELFNLSINLEDEYCENGGEVTETTESMEQRIAALQDLLLNDGVDALGRWLKSTEDAIKALKAERDSIARQMKAKEQTIDFIKSQIHDILVDAGVEKVKGTTYSFAVAKSVTTSVDKDMLKDMFMSAIESRLRGADKVIPDDVTITLGASVSALPEGSELPAYYERTEKDTCKFTKPRASKEA